MRLCLHGKAANKCRHQVPWLNGFYGCNNAKRYMIELEYCGKKPEECKGFGLAKITKVDDGNPNT